MKEPKINIILVLLSVVVCIVYFFIYLIEKNNSMALLSVAAIVLPFIPYIVEKIIKRKLPNILKFTYLMLAFFGTIVGSIVDLYDKSMGYDKIVHFFSGIMISTLAAYFLKYICKDSKHNTLIFIFLILVFNTAASGFWEIIEYTYDLTLNGNAQRGLIDTMQDMICALLGGILFVLIYMDRKKLN